jgi:hypothetical protein
MLNKSIEVGGDRCSPLPTMTFIETIYSKSTIRNHCKHLFSPHLVSGTLLRAFLLAPTGTLQIGHAITIVKGRTLSLREA